MRFRRLSAAWKRTTDWLWDYGKRNFRGHATFFMLIYQRRLSGKEATALILKAAQKVRKNAEAAEWCAEYAFDGIKAGTGFLPNKEELKRIFGNRKKLRESFALLNSGGLSGNCLQEYAFYWSSFENSYNDGSHAWVVSPSDGYHGPLHISFTVGHVRCAVEFKV